MVRPATVVPTAAPAVPSRGRGPRPVMNAILHAMFRAVRRIPRCSGVRASPAARNAPPTMKKSSNPMLPTNMIRRNGKASTRTAGAAFTTPSSDGARIHPRGASTRPHSASAARNAWYVVRLTFSGSLAPAKRATRPPMPLIEHRPEAVWRVTQEICDGHLAREDEGHGAGEQPYQEEQAAKRLEHSRDAGQRRDRRGAPARHDGCRKREQLGRPELHEEKGRDDAKHAEQARGPARPLRAEVRCGHDALLRWFVSRMAVQRDSRRGSPKRSARAAKSSVGPRHRSSSTSRNSGASVRSVASCLNRSARSRPSPSTVAGKSSMGPYWFRRRAAVTAPIPGMPG